MASVKCIHFSKQEKDMLSILMPSVICVHFSQLVDCCNIGIHLITSIEHTHAKISVLECQVSWGDTNGEVVDH